MRVLDGGVTDNTPVFKDGKRRQIVFQLTDIAYPMTLSLRWAARNTCLLDNAWFCDVVLAPVSCLSRIEAYLSK